MAETISYFHIEFNNPTAIYEPGMDVIARMEFILDEPLTVRGVRLQFTGKASVRWETGGENSTTFGDEQIYFEEHTIWGNARGSDAPNPIMPTGKHDFDFKFTLPDKILPGSFTGNHGWIKYAVTVCIDRPKFRFDIRKEKEIIIRPPSYDLKFEPRTLEPISINEDKQVCCWCCASAHITCTMQVPKTGYLAGEIVSISADITNESYKTVEEVNLKLVQTTHFIAGHARTYAWKIFSIVTKNEPIHRGCTQEWRNEGIRIPPLSEARPTMDSESLCKVIKIVYAIVFEIIPKGCSFRFEVAAPIIIGTPPPEPKF